MSIDRLKTFVQSFTCLIERYAGDESSVLTAGTELLAELVATDDWLPAQFARCNADSYQQNLLHCDPLQRFSVVSFVWGPGQGTPIHDHTVWGLVGLLRGQEVSQQFFSQTPDSPLVPGPKIIFSPGMVERLSPAGGDIHQVANANTHGPSVSIHVYGANIGNTPRHIYDAQTGRRSRFVSGYNNRTIPNIWSSATHAAL